MGMTIDNAKEWLKLAVPIKALTQEEFATFIQSVNLAVDTMEKYRQIEQILKDIPYGGDATVRRIQEVVEDGNDNN